MTTNQIDTPMFRIGQNVRLRSGGPDMIVNDSTLGVDGKFMVATVWYDIMDGQTTAFGSYKEALLDSIDGAPHKKARLV
jgi:uncharacterized protein YodC (DUF2158 family)